MRGLRNRRYRNPADPKVSHAQPPLHGNVGTKKTPAIVIWGACAPVSYLGSQARSLNWQRRVEGSLREEDAQSWLGGGVGERFIENYGWAIIVAQP
jgi:hypothetical protein